MEGVERQTHGSVERGQWVPASFPASLATVLLVSGFLLTRVFVGLHRDHPWVGPIGTFVVVSGVFLALVSIGALLWESARAEGRIAWMAVRSVFAAPVLLLVVRAMGGAIDRRIQLAAMVGACLTLAVACVRGTVRARGGVEVRVTLGLLLIGQLAEFIAPVLRMFSLPSMPLSLWAARVEPIGEFAAFVGVAGALVWALRSTARSVGRARTAAFVAMPAALGLVLALLPTRYPRTTDSVARYAFGARFDLATLRSFGHPSALALSAYTLLFSALITAASVSLAAQFLDRGASVRRTLGWGLVLVSGFGAVSLAGPVDPLRVTSLLLGVLLLEQAAELELDDAPEGSVHEAV